MKYRIILALTVEADPADFGGAARKGFNALANQFTNGQPVEIHLLPQDDSDEAFMAERVLACCMRASSTPSQATPTPPIARAAIQQHIGY